MTEIKADIIIIGAGLTGLTLAFLLKKHNVKVVIVEARKRLGGRIFTKKNENCAPVELGATWLHQENIQLLELLQKLNVKTFKQEMGDFAIYEGGGQSPVQLIKIPETESPSFRIQNGTQAIIEKLSSEIEDDQIFLKQRIKTIELKENSIAAKSISHTFNASVVISTLPPMLFVDKIETSPELPNQLIEIAKKTQTWMGDSIKISLTFKNKFWQKNNLTGTVFSNVGPVTELYDHSNYENNLFALKGFLNPNCFVNNKKERLMMVLNQLQKYYGSQVNDFTNYEEVVWKHESNTSVKNAAFVLPHQNNGNTIYQKSYLQDRLIIAGTETSLNFGGYMEGAIQSANKTFANLKTNDFVNV